MAKKPTSKEAPVGEAAQQVAVPETPKTGLPANQSAMLMEDAGAGTEHITSQDQVIPFLRILQSNSPQCVKRGEKEIKGCEPSFFFNTATEEFWDGEKGVALIPCVFQRRYTEWWPRNDDDENSTKGKKKGLVRDWGADDTCLKGTTKDKRNRDVTAAGTYISTDMTHYCLLLKEDFSFERVVASMTSTQIGKSRRWNTMMTSRQEPRPDGKGTFIPPTFYAIYRATSVPESNDDGQWYGWKIAPEGKVLDLPNGEEVYLAARAFRDAVNQGLVKVAAPDEPVATGSSSGDKLDDDIPF